MHADLATGACRLAFVEESTGSTEGLLAFWRRNYYKVGLGGKIFNEGQGFTNKFCMFFELDEIFVLRHDHFPLGLGCCEGCRGTVVLVDTFSGADLGST